MSETPVLVQSMYTYAVYSECRFKDFHSQIGIWVYVGSANTTLNLKSLKNNAWMYYSFQEKIGRISADRELRDL